MQIVIHPGALGTGGERLLTALAASVPALAAAGVTLAEPVRCRALLESALHRHRDYSPAAGEEARLIADLGYLDRAERLLLSHPSLMGPVQEMLVAGQFYPAAAARLAALRALFPRTPVSFALAIGDPVRLLARALEDDPEAGVLPAPASESAASALRWSLPLTRLRAQCPDVEITLWDVEDLPGVQDEVLIALVGPAAAALADAAAVILSGGLSRQGESVLAGYLAARPPHDRAGVERIAAIFRKHFRAGDDPPDPAVPPGWEASIATEIGALYREDRARIAAIDGVRLLRGTPTA